MSSSLVDTERGGDSQYDQYTSQRTSLATSESAPKSSTGQLGGTSTSSSSDGAGTSSQRGEQTAANIRYGQAISEEGFGGKTEGGLGGADQAATHGGEGARTAQGYKEMADGDEVGA